MDDNQILKLLQSNGIAKDCKLSKKFCSYDAFNDNVILEFKYRKSTYSNYLIEAKKIIDNFHISQHQNKEFYYIVVTDSDILIWNIDELIGGLKFELKELPAKTEFNDDRKIKKLITYLEINDARKKFLKKI